MRYLFDYDLAHDRETLVGFTCEPPPGVITFTKTVQDGILTLTMDGYDKHVDINMVGGGMDLRELTENEMIARVLQPAATALRNKL